MTFKAGKTPSPSTTTSADPSTITSQEPTSLSGSAEASFTPAVDVEVNDGSHISGIRFGAEEIDRAAVVTIDGGPPPATMAYDDFHKLFCGAFRTASELSGFRSLDVTKEPDRAAAASRAWYETCEDLPWLRWMIQPGNKWVVRGFAVGGLFAPMAVGVAGELRERREPKGPRGSGQPSTRPDAPQDAPEPANDLGWVPNERKDAA